jgi:defect-in-organelle-trafficking protein DotD
MRPGFGIAFLGAALLAGCAAPVHPVPTTVATPGMPNPETALQKSMNDVNAEMAELGQLTPAATTPVNAPVMPGPLQKTVSFSWNGSLDQGVAKLAQSVGYTFYVTAPANAQPVNVSITISSVPAFQVFQALGEEAGTKATVEVDPLHHQVQVIHHV